MAEQTSALALDQNGAAVHRIAGLAGQRCRNGVAHHRVGHQRVLRCAGGATEREDRQCKRAAADHPKVSPVMVRNQASACSASSLRVVRGASAGLMITPGGASTYWSSAGR